MEIEKFISELKLSPLSAATSLDVDSASDLYNSTLSGILDKMIPLETVRIHERPDPRFDRECRTSKCLKRSLERIYMRTKSENDFAAWMGQKKLYKRLCRHKRRNYWNNKLSDAKNKTLNIWSHINSVSGRGKRSSVDGIKPIEFQSFLLKKVESARNSIRAREKFIYLAHAQEGGLIRLQDVDEDELLKAIQRLPNKQCASDPIPTWLLKKISRIILIFVKIWSISLF